VAVAGSILVEEVKVIDLDVGAYDDEPEDTPQTPLAHLRTKDNSPIRRRHYEKNMLAQHSSKSWEHYTPDSDDQPYVSMIRRVLGTIDTDPASSWLAQRTIQAERWFGLQQDRSLSDGLLVTWYGNIYLNPPGGHTCLVRPEMKHISRSYPVIWWLKLCADYVAGNVTSAVYMGFSLEQMVTTQREGTPSVLDFPFCVPRSRINFNYPEDTIGGKPISTSDVATSSNATHANVIVYLPPNTTPHDAADGVDRFKEVFEAVGTVVIS